MFRVPATVLCDFYKLSHRPQYPVGTTLVSSTWTPRTSRIPGITQVVANAGLQIFIKEWLLDYFHTEFFSHPKADVIAEYVRFVKFTLGDQNPYTAHLEQLHDLQYLPLSIRALPEGTMVPLRVPTMVVENTHPDFFWLTNYIESLASCELWQASTDATLALEYRKILDQACEDTGGDPTFVQFQGHDFSFRGMAGVYAATRSGVGHLLSFTGTDTCPAIVGCEYYYNANIEKELVGTSVPATEHSVMCANGTDDEYEVYKRIITELYPNGIISVVSDTMDFWNIIGNVLPRLKSEILARKGGPVGDKLVIRPDSGDPVKIICGDKNAVTELERKGLIEALWDIFGGTETSKGYRLLDSHIGAIYGDAITLERCQEIVNQLKAKGFASTNIVFGIGSYTYQYNTRDTFGYALKSTLCVVNGEERKLFKSPKTDDGTKTSQKGRVAVVSDNMGGYTYIDNLGLNDVCSQDFLVEVFRDGKLLVDDTLANIRGRLEVYRKSQLKVT
jgi:nicotinamide phosphoribosyltransferase